MAKRLLWRQMHAHLQGSGKREEHPSALAPRTLQGKDLSIIDVHDLEEHPTHSWAAWLFFEGKRCSLNYWCLLFC